MESLFTLYVFRQNLPYNWWWPLLDKINISIVYYNCLSFSRYSMINGSLLTSVIADINLYSQLTICATLVFKHTIPLLSQYMINSAKLDHPSTNVNPPKLDVGNSLCRRLMWCTPRPLNMIYGCDNQNNTICLQYRRVQLFNNRLSMMISQKLSNNT